MNDVLIEYEAAGGAERGEVRRMRVTKDEAVAAADRIRAAGGKVLEWWLVADVRRLEPTRRGHLPAANLDKPGPK